MALSRDKQIWIGVVVLAGLGGLVYMQQKKDQAVGTQTTTAAEIPEIKGPEDVDKISITNAEKGEVVLEKKGDKWMLTKPVAAPANQGNVKQLIDNMKELKAKEVISNNVNDEQRKDFQFDPGHAVHLVAWKGADKKVDDSFGKSGARGQLVMVEGKPGVFAASGYSSYLYAREVKGWRDTEIFKFDDANANQLTIENKNGVLSFTKGDKWAGTWKDKPIERFDESKVGDCLRTFKGLSAEDFGDGKSAADTGLDSPEATVTISLKDNAGKYVLHVGKTSTGTTRFAQKDGDATIFVVSSAASDWATAEVAKLQKPLDGGTKDASAAAPTPMEMPMGMEGMGGMPPGMPHGMPHGH